MADHPDKERRPASESLYDIDQDPVETEDLASEHPDLRLRLGASLDAYLAKKTSGIHLRIVNDTVGDPTGCEVLLQTKGRFAEVSGVRLEPEDRFELSDDEKRLILDRRLEHRLQTTRTQPRLVPEEDGLVFLVSPPGSSIVVQQLRLANGRELPLRAGAQRQLEAVPFAFEAADSALPIRDVGELLGDAGSEPEGGDVEAYLGVVPASVESQELPKELLGRLRALGYLN